MDQEEMADQITAACSQSLFHNQDQNSASGQARSDIVMSSQSRWLSSTEDTDQDGLSNGTCEVETMVALHCPGDVGDAADHLALSNDGMSEFSNSDLSLPEVCISTNSSSFDEDMSYEVQQAYRIFTGFLLDKHKGITNSFLHPVGHQEAKRGVGAVRGWGQAQLKQSMCLRRMEEKFVNQEYETITEFVADFRLMLENCYRYHGVDHWISKQAQKLEIMLEQKLTLLSRTLREKTTLAVTSKGRFGAEEDRGSGGTSTRRRLAPRSLATITVGGHESIMVQTLRLEEQQRAKDEKRQRELEKKEAEEMSAKEVEEWEQSLLSQASPHSVDTLWELPAIGHFLCLAQTALNLPEIVFFELERCLLMPRCSTLLSKIMSSLLCPPQRRATLHRRPALPYCHWEAELRQRVMSWYRAVGASRNQPGRAEQLGLCHQFFRTLGPVSPLEEKPFHLLPFYQRLWLLKGLCDHVYETQKDVQDALLSQPIHECRESILGYDSKENAYIHFPHFCGADLRIYCQSPSTPPTFPFPSIRVKKVEAEPEGTEGEELDDMKDKRDTGRCGVPMETGDSEGFGNGRTETFGIFKRENGEDGEEQKKKFKLWSLKKEEGSESGSSDEDDSKSDLETHTNAASLSHATPFGRGVMDRYLKKESADLGQHLLEEEEEEEEEQGFSLGSVRTIKAETQEPCLSVGEHFYTGRSPARLVGPASPTKSVGGNLGLGHQRASCSECRCSKTSQSEEHNCSCGTSRLETQLSSESAQNSSEERMNDKIWTKKKKRKKKRGREQLARAKGEHKQLQDESRTRPSPAEAAKSALRRVTATNKRKDKKKKIKAGKKFESSRKVKDEPTAEPSFKLVCTSLDELRDLISKTEDELDDLESTKKRLGRWYYRREAVKDLHSTLIRLLNELSPWEPKLAKAFQRNRLRLKKEFDDFKKHPEYKNFVREERTSSSSDEDDEERGSGKEACSLSDHHRRSEEEDMEHVVPRGLWSGANNREILPETGGESTGTYVSPSHLKQSLTSPEKGVSLSARVHTGSSAISPSATSGPQSRCEPIPSALSQDSQSARATGSPAQVSQAPRPPILHTTGLPKGYTPIPTLLAKSVGNKVTLMKRPDDYPAVNDVDGQSRDTSLFPSASAATATKLSKAQRSPSGSQQNTQQLQQMEVPRQPGMTMVTAALPKSPQVKPTQTVPKSPVQVVYKVPEGLGQLIRTDSSSPVKISVQPVMNQNSGDKIMQQVVILPPNLLIQKPEEKVTLHQQQAKSIQVPVSKVTSPICMSTNVPGFTIPESRIPVQQVAPLKDARTSGTPSPSVSPCLPQGSMNAAVFNRTQVGGPRVSTTQGVAPYPSPITSPSSTASTDSIKATDPKQELKTVCIRDSQSILVTTRGGNTGIVKVQTSDQNALGSLSTSSVITISPQFKAFLVSKTSTTLSSSASSQTSTPAVTSISVAQPQKQLSSALHSPPTVSTAAITGSIPVTGSGNQSASTAVPPLGQGFTTAATSTVSANIGQLAQAAVGASRFQAPLVKNTVVVPSLTSSGVLTQAEFIGKTGVKRPSTEDRSQVTKFILVTPTSSSASNVAIPKGIPSPTKSHPGSRVMFISQPTASSPTTSVGSIPKLEMATSLPNQTLKMGLVPGQPAAGVNSEALSKVKNVPLPSGVQVQLSGKTTTIGQTIGALSRSPSKNAPVPLSDGGHPTASGTGLVSASHSNIITNCPAQLSSLATLSTSSPLQGVASFTMSSQSGPSASTSTLGNTMKNDLGFPPNILSSKPLAQVTTTLQSRPAQTSTPALVHQPSSIQSGAGEESTFYSSPSQLAVGKSQTAISSAAPANTQLSTSTAGTIQQRIVINTSSPLSAGTQILLNNTRFVVPPQGLGPGSHVLIISSPAPQQVPPAGATSAGSSLPPQGPGQVVVRAPVLPQSPARMPGPPAVNCPFVARTPAISPSLLAANATPPVRITGTPSLGPAVLPIKTNVVSALTRLPATEATGSFASNPIGAPTLLSSLPRLGSAPAVASPVVTSASVRSAALPTIRLAAGTPTHSECSPTMPAVAPPLLSRLSSFPVLPSVPTAFSSPVAPVVAGTQAFLPSPPAQPVTAPGPLIHPQQTPPAAPSAALSQTFLHTGLDGASVKKAAPAVMQPLLAGPRTQVLPTVAVPPIVNAVSRMQALPIATVTPIGSTVNTFETAPVVTALSSSSTVIITPSQPITSLKMNSTFHPPVVLAGQAVANRSLQPPPSLGVHTSVASKLLISPDGAVLNTVQCQVSPADLTACPKPLDALMVSSNSSSAALHTHDSSLQSSQADRKCAN